MKHINVSSANDVSSSAGTLVGRARLYAASAESNSLQQSFFNAALLFLPMILVVLAGASAIAQTTAPPELPSLEVRVYPPTLEGKARALENFLASGSNDAATDARLSMALATDFYAAGDGEGVIEALGAALDRIKGDAEGDHLARAALHDALSLVHHADGDIDRRLKNLRIAAAETRRALGPDHTQTFMARIHLANATAESGQSLPLGYYGKAAKDLQKLVANARRTLGESHPVTLTAELSLAVVNLGGGDISRGENRLDKVIELVERNEGVLQPFKTVALALKTRLYDFFGAEEKRDAVLAKLESMPLPEDDMFDLLDPGRKELEAKTRTMRRKMVANGGNLGATTSSAGFLSDDAGSRVDISFCVDAAGNVRDAVIVDREGRESWAERMLASMQKRRYRVPEGAEGCTPRLERFTITSPMVTPTGSHIKGRYALTYLVNENLLDAGLLDRGYLDLATSSGPP